MMIPGREASSLLEVDGATRWAQKTSGAVPGLRNVYSDHVAFYDEFLLHVMMFEIEAWAEKEYARDRDSADLCRLIVCLEEGATQDNGYLENAIAVSFVEMLWGSWLILRLGPAVSEIARSMYPDIFENGEPRKPLSAVP